MAHTVSFHAPGCFECPTLHISDKCSESEVELCISLLRYLYTPGIHRYRYLHHPATAITKAPLFHVANHVIS